MANQTLKNPFVMFSSQAFFVSYRERNYILRWQPNSLDMVIPEIVEAEKSSSQPELLAKPKKDNRVGADTLFRHLTIPNMGRNKDHSKNSLCY